jgi:hypothetical protein
MEHDRWLCRNGKYATFRKIKYQKNHPEKHYLTTRADCKGCPFASECIGISYEKRIRITVYKEYYDRAVERQLTKKAKYYKTLRQSTVEPVFGTLINHTGMRKINTRGIESANKVMLMAAMAYNLKKLLRYGGGNTRGKAAFEAFWNNLKAYVALIKAVLESNPNITQELKIVFA